jgi:hypothetical protein
MTTFQTGPELDIPGLGFVGSTRSDKQREALQPTQAKSSFSDTFAAFFRNNPGGLTFDFVATPGSEFDPSFVLTKELFDNASNGIADEYLGDLADANSLADLEKRREYALERTRRMGVIANAGTTSRVSAAIIAGVVDPFSLAAGALTGGAGLGVGLTTAARVTRAASAGLLTNAGLEAYRASLDPTVTGRDIAVSALSGAGMGAGLGGTITRSMATRAFASGVGAAAPVAAFQADGDALESAIGIGTAFLAGGVAGTLTPRVREQLKPIIRNQVKTMAHEELTRAGALTPDGKAYFGEQADPKVFEARQRAAADAVSDGVAMESAQFDASFVPTDAPKPDTFAFAFSPFAAEVDEKLALASRRQFKQDVPPGFRAVSGEKSLVARLSDDGHIEVGDAFFAKSKAERVAAIEDAANGGVDIAGAGDRFLLEAAKRHVQDRGYISAQDLYESFGKRNADGTVSPRFTRDQAQRFADRLTALAVFEQRRMGREPIQQNTVTLAEAESSVASLGLPADTLSKARQLSQDVGQVSASKIANRLKISYADSQKVADAVRLLGTPFILRPKERLLSGGGAVRPAAVAASPSAPDVARPTTTVAGPVITTEPTTAVGAATQQDTRLTAASPFGDTYDQTIPLPKNGFFTPQQATDARPTGLSLGTMEAMVGNSPVPSIRQLGSMVFDDPVPKQDGNVFEAMPSWIKARVGEYASPFLRVAEKTFDDAATRLGMDDDAISRAWYKAVVTGAKDAPEEIRPLVDATAPLMKDVLNLEKSHQVAGAADVPENDLYIPRKGRRERIDGYIRQYNEGPVAEIVANAFKARRPAASDELATAIGKAWIKRIGVPNDPKFVRADAFDTVINLLEEANVKPELINEARIILEDHVNLNTDKGLRAQLRQTADADTRASIRGKIGDAITERDAISKRASLLKRLAKATDETKKAKIQKQIGTLDAIFAAPNEEAKRIALDAAKSIIRPKLNTAIDTGNPSNFKFRLDLDDLVETTMPDGTRLSLLDLIETDPRVLIPHRIRRAAGNSAFAQVLKWSQNPNAPARPFMSLAELLDSLRKDAEAAGITDRSQEGNIRRLEIGLKFAIGMPIDDVGNPGTQRAVRMAKVANELVGAKFLSGTATGLSNLTETVGAMATTQLRATFEVMPALKELHAMALDGKLTNNDLALAEVFTGGGIDRLTNNAPHRPMGPAIAKFDRALTWLEPKSRKLTDALMKVSLMQAGNDISQKIIGARLVRMWGNWIGSEKQPPAKWLKGTGLEEKPWMVARIMEQGKKFGTREGKHFNMNWYDWDDVEAAVALRSAVNIEFNRNFLQPNTVSGYAWSATWYGKLALQLQRWPLAAFRSKLVYGLATGDVRHWVSMTTSTATLSMVYILRTYAESLGQDDPQKYREERLSLAAIARATVGRAAFTSLLPSAIDGVAGVTGFEPPFAISSTSGRRNDLKNPLDNIPVVKSVMDIARAVPSVVQPAVDSEYSFSMQDLRKIERAIMPNAIKQLHVIDAVGRMLGLPEESRE